MIYIDFETRSKAVIQKTGAWRYAVDPSTDVLCMGYAIDDGPVEIWTPGEFFPFSAEQLAAHQFEAHFSFFERSIWKNVMVKKYGWPPVPDEKWVCSASIACAHALPRSLSDLGIALKLEHQKDLGGKRIMMKLSRPRTKYAEDPAEMWSNGNEDFRVLYEYCRDDVQTEREVTRRLRPLPPQEREIWLLDQKINERGIRVDMPAVRAALTLLDQYSVRLKAEFQALTGLDSPTQRDRFLEWLKRQNVKIDKLAKNDVLTVLEKETLTPAVRRALEIRQSLSRTSTAKYAAIVDCVSEGDRLRGLLTYHGASTGRWVGQLVQPQNLPVNRFKGDLETYFKILKQADLEAFELCYPDIMPTIASTIRGVFIPSEDHVFFGGDYSAIEARVLFWLAGESRGLNMFRTGEDIYRDLATKIYSVPLDKVTPPQRDLGKRGILGCGYGMGAEKFEKTCWDFARVKITKELAERVVSVYRTQYRTVPVLWQLQELAAKEALETKRTVRCGKVIWGVHDGFLFCRLPSGRCLAYYDPKIAPVKTSWGETKMALTYMALNSMTKQWERDATYGGKIVENITQAVARDVMAEAMLRCEKAGFKVVLTVHDELLTEANLGPAGNKDPDTIEHHRQKFQGNMATPPAWAVGLPIKAEAWTGKRYKK